jgi:hypothetical protein
MFNLFRRKHSSANFTPTIRDTLFGDLPVDQWPPENGSLDQQEPWLSFVQARNALAQGQTERAIQHWIRVSEMPALESRHYAQAWHFLRSRGAAPPAEKAKTLLGVVLEVPMHGGLDLLAAYPEHTARYYNYSGAGVVWEHPDDSLDKSIDALLDAGNRILQVIGPTDQPRMPVPPEGSIRITMLAPSGLHFGQGPFGAMAADPLAKPAVDAATALMQQLVAKGGGPASA